MQKTSLKIEVDFKQGSTHNELMEKSIKYQQYCPIALTSEILCNRWTTLILRAFFCGAHSFSDIQKSAPSMPSATLSSRLKQLEAANIIKRDAGNYHLTEAGIALFPILDQMGLWAQKWLRRDVVKTENLDPNVLFWELRQLNIKRGYHVETQRVVEFILPDMAAPKHRYWIIFKNQDIEICHKDPGYEPDLWVEADIKTLVEIWLGHIKLEAAINEGALMLDGDKVEITAFKNWFLLSHFAKNELQD